MDTLYGSSSINSKQQPFIFSVDHIPQSFLPIPSNQINWVQGPLPQNLPTTAGQAFLLEQSQENSSRKRSTTNHLPDQPSQGVASVVSQQLRYGVDDVSPIRFSITTEGGREIISLEEDEKDGSLTNLQTGAQECILPQPFVPFVVDKKNGIDLITIVDDENSGNQTTPAASVSGAQRKRGIATVNEGRIPKKRQTDYQQVNGNRGNRGGKKPARRSRKPPMSYLGTLITPVTPSAAVGPPTVCPPNTQVNGAFILPWQINQQPSLPRLQNQPHSQQELDDYPQECNDQVLEAEIRQLKMRLRQLEDNRQEILSKTRENECQEILRELDFPVSIFKVVGPNGGNDLSDTQHESAQSLSWKQLRRIGQLKVNFLAGAQVVGPLPFSGVRPDWSRALEVIWVDFVWNDTLYKAFKSTKEIFRALGKPTNEILLFHKTAEENVDRFLFSLFPR